MNRIDLAYAVSQKTGLKKADAEKVINAVVESITEALVRGEKVQIVGFGQFETKERKAYTGHDPRTNEPIEIAPIRVASFRPGKNLKEAVSK